MSRISRITTAVVQANFDYTFVRIHTDDGIYGTGEAFFAPGGPAAIRDLGQVLIGQDPTNVRPLWDRLVRAAGGTAGVGTSLHAVSGLEAALWDLTAKLVDRPLVDLLGGRYRSVIEIYADLHGGSELESLDNVMRYRVPFWQSSDGRTQAGRFYWEAAEPGAGTFDLMAERARDAIKSNFRRLKFDLDVFAEEREPADRTISRSDLRRIGDNVMGLREVVGDDIEIAFDCHWRFDVPAALAVAEVVAPANPMWLEDPVPPDPESHGMVAARSPVPIATGENVYLLDGFIRLVERHGAHILTPDVQKTGGISETLRIADYADRHFLPIAPHCIASPLGLVAAAHVCAAVPNFMCLEFHGIDVPFWADLVQGEGSVINDGACTLPDAPGIGVELDTDVVRAHAAPGEPVFDEPPAR